MASSNSLVGRAVLAVALLVGFYVLAIGVALGLLWLPLAEVLYTDRIHIKLALLCLFASLAILWSILPRVDRFEAPGPRLTAEENPELFRVIEDVARDTDQSMPADVFLVSDLNAFVTERGGVMGLGSRRVMGLGLPLLQVLSVSELRAVVAHEFGHFHGGDTKLGPWIYKTRSAMGRTLETLSSSEMGFMAIVMLPFLAYQKLFLRVTHAISRAQEYAADALAARTQGAHHLTDGLRKIHGAAMAFGPYLGNELSPALDAGFHPPIAQGFARFIEAPEVSAAIGQALDHAMENQETDLLDTHPALKDRIAAVASIACDVASDDAPAISLLGDVAASERALLELLLVGGAVSGLKPIDWEHVGTEVFAPMWKEQTAGNAAALDGLTPRTYPSDPTALAELVCRAEPRAADAPVEVQVAMGQGVFGAALATALVEQGWALSAEPGAAVTLRKGDHVVEPFNALRQVAEGELDEAVWHGLLDDAGIADVQLSGGAAG